MVVEDFVEQDPCPAPGSGRAGLADALAAVFTAFLDLHDTITEDDRIPPWAAITKLRAFCAGRISLPQLVCSRRQARVVLDTSTRRRW